MLLAGIVLACLPRAIDLSDPTGATTDRLRGLPLFDDPFTLVGGTLVLWAFHLLAVTRKCRR